MSAEVALLLVLLVGTLVLFVLELFPTEVPALALLAALVVTGLVAPADAVAGFSNPAVVAIAGLFVLSHALTKTGILESLAERLEGPLRRNRWLGVAGLLLAVAVLSGFLNNTAVVALFIPFTMSLCDRLEISPSKMLIPLSYASIFGGTLTLIGTSTNLIVSAIARDSGMEPFSMFELSGFGAVLLVVGIVYVVIAGPRLLPERVSPGSLSNRFDLDDFLTEVRVQEESTLVGRSCKGAGIGREYGLNVVAILRGEESYTENVGTLPLTTGDVLLLQGDVGQLPRLRKDFAVSLLDDVKLAAGELSEGEMLTVEVLVPPRSRYVGSTLSELDFRNTVGPLVMAIRRSMGALVRAEVAHTVLRAWDSLLMLVSPTRLEELRSSQQNLIVLGEHRLGIRRQRRWWLILIVLPAVIVVAALGVLEISAAALVGVVVLLLARVIRPVEAYQSIDWGVIFLIAAFVPVGTAVESSGAADYLAQWMLKAADLLPVAAPYAVLALVYLATSLLTQMISNAAAAIVLAPIAITLATTMGLDPRPFLIAVTFAASAEFMTPMGYQTNMMVYAPGQYRFLDYTKIGLPLNLVFWLLAILLIPRIWPFE